jgi:soluble lytic murein transglycosylase-like protein
VTAIPLGSGRTGSHWLPVEVLPAAHVGHRPARHGRALGLAAALLALALLAPAVIRGWKGAPESNTARATESAVPAVVAGDVSLVALVPTFERWGRAYEVPADLLEALAWHESRWQAGAQSEAGAVGIGQLMPSTAAAVARRIGKPLDPWRPADNIRLMSRLLADLIAANHGDERRALAEYAQGSPSVAKSGVTPLTARYVEEVFDLRDQFRPPDTEG